MRVAGATRVLLLAAVLAVAGMAGLGNRTAQALGNTSAGWSQEQTLQGPAGPVTLYIDTWTDAMVAILFLGSNTIGYTSYYSASYPDLRVWNPVVPPGSVLVGTNPYQAPIVLGCGSYACDVAMTPQMGTPVYGQGQFWVGLYLTGLTAGTQYDMNLGLSGATVETSFSTPVSGHSIEQDTQTLTNGTATYQVVPFADAMVVTGNFTSGYNCWRGPTYSWMTATGSGGYDLTSYGNPDAWGGSVYGYSGSGFGVFNGMQPGQSYTLQMQFTGYCYGAGGVPSVSVTTEPQAGFVQLYHGSEAYNQVSAQVQSGLFEADTWSLSQGVFNGSGSRTDTNYFGVSVPGTQATNWQSGNQSPGWTYQYQASATVVQEFPASYTFTVAVGQAINLSVSSQGVFYGWPDTQIVNGWTQGQNVLNTCYGNYNCSVTVTEWTPGTYTFTGGMEGNYGGWATSNTITVQVVSGYGGGSVSAGPSLDDQEINCAPWCGDNDDGADPSYWPGPPFDGDELVSTFSASSPVITPQTTYWTPDAPVFPVAGYPWSPSANPSQIQVDWPAVYDAAPYGAAVWPSWQGWPGPQVWTWGTGWTFGGPFNAGSTYCFGDAASIPSGPGEGGAGWAQGGCVTIPPNPPSNVTLGSPTPTSLTATWSTNGNGSGTSYQAVIENMSGQWLAAGSTPNTWYTFGGLTPNTEYKAQVAAQAGGQSSGYVTSNAAWTLAEQPNINGTSSTTGSITITWSPNGNPSGTYYRVSLDGGNTVTTTGTSWTFSALAPNTQHTVCVTAQNVGYGTWTAQSCTYPWTQMAPPGLSLNPNAVVSGNAVTATVTTQGTVTSVTLNLPWSGGIAMTDQGGGVWTATFPAPQVTSEQTYTVTATACNSYSGSCATSGGSGGVLYVYQPITITGSLSASPNPAQSGSSVTATIQVSGPVSSVNLSVPWSSTPLAMADQGGGTWSVAFVAPSVSSPTTYTLTATAYGQPSQQVTSSTTLGVYNITSPSGPSNDIQPGSGSGIRSASSSGTGTSSLTQ